MYNIEIAPVAMAELSRIVAHISQELHNPTAATNLIERIENCYSRLEKTPFAYEVCRDPYLKARGYRRAIIKNYILFYSVDEDSSTVKIHHFVYGPRDYTRLI